MRYCGECGTALSPGPPPTCPGCGRTHHRNSKPCAGALIENSGRLLLVRRGIDPFLDCWDIPGGHCENGEHPADTAVRETLEETGWAIVPTEIFGIWMESDGTDHSLIVYYRARPIEQVAPPQAAETAELRWFDAGSLPENLAFPGHARDVLTAWRCSIVD